MGADEVPLWMHSLLRRAGLSKVPKPILLGVAILGALLVVACLWQFWPRANADFIAQVSHGSTASQPEATSELADKIVIDIEGAIVSPGLYGLPKDARIGDAVQAAGGLSTDAAIGAVNLAQKLSDGELVYIPTLEEQSQASSLDFPASSKGAAPSAPDDKINVNSATASELEQLDGVGPALSRRIVEYRESKGRFTSLEDLKNVPGIGEKKYEGIKDRIRL